MTPDRLMDLRRKAERASPGPWIIARSVLTLPTARHPPYDPNKCAACDRSELIATEPNLHVHLWPAPPDRQESTVLSTTTQRPVIAHTEGGEFPLSPEDADHVTAADPTTVQQLIRLILLLETGCRDPTAPHRAAALTALGQFRRGTPS